MGQHARGAEPAGPAVEDDKALRHAVPLGVAAATFVVFLPALQGQFLTWDDEVNFVRNHSFRGLSWVHIKWMWTTTLMGQYIPLTWMSLGLNYVVGGMDPSGYHLGNMILHTANAVLFYFVARRLLALGPGVGGASLACGAAFAALAFAIHPLRVESVAWITERRDVLCGLFSLLAVLAYLRWHEGAGSARWRGASVLAFSAALLSKQQAVPLPVGLLILDVYPLGRHRSSGWRRMLIEKIPYFFLSGAGGIAALIAVRQGSHLTEYREYGPGSRLAMTAYGLVFYLRKWLWPTALTPVEEVPPRIDPFAPRFLTALLLTVLITAVVIALRRRWPGGLAAWTYSTAMLLPVIGPLHSGLSLVHDRYSYLSGLGFAMLAGGALTRVLGAKGPAAPGQPIRGLCGAVAVLTLAALGYGTWSQTWNWTDSETLWRWAVEVDPHCAVCANNLGNAILADHRGTARPSPLRAAMAETAYRKSLAERDLARVHNNLGVALAVQGRSDEAEEEFQAAIRREPGLVDALRNLAQLYADRGRHAEAQAYHRRALAAAADRSDARRMPPPEAATSAR